MNVRFGLICAAVIVTLGGYTGKADGQIVTITASGYVAPQGGVNAKVNPQGTWSKTPNSGEWKVTYDFGTVNNGNFTLDGTIGVGASVNLPAADGNGTWGPTGLETLLKNPLPAGTTIRARILKKVGQNWVPQGVPAYSPVGPAAGGGGD